jgi:hypothetical protein
MRSGSGRVGTSGVSRDSAGDIAAGAAEDAAVGDTAEVDAADAEAEGGSAKGVVSEWADATDATATVSESAGGSTVPTAAGVAAPPVAAVSVGRLDSTLVKFSTLVATGSTACRGASGDRRDVSVVGGWRDANSAVSTGRAASSGSTCSALVGRTEPGAPATMSAKDDPSRAGAGAPPPEISTFSGAKIPEPARCIPPESMTAATIPRTRRDLIRGPAR